MTDNNFDVDGLARYLHLTPQQIERLATRGNVPARKVSGKWRFSLAEIHHWLEGRMGLLEDGELMHVEGALARADNLTASDISIREMLHEEAIAIPLQGRTKNSVISEMTDLASRTGMLWDPDRMADAIRQREQMQTTAMDNGIALLHPRRPLSNALSEPVLSLGVSRQGIPFGGGRRLTDLFILICSTDDRGHLRTLARLSRLMVNDQLLDALRNAACERDAYEVMCQAEEDLVG